ncbi:MAG: hypothetical protein E7445_08860 [Ruminococcaceae bacterium]|nr:hypothetical protein [Oscillospiraceae bacterium]
MTNLKISERLMQPQVYHYISCLGRADYRNVNCSMTYTERCYELMDALFALLERIKPISAHGVKSVWLCARRGTIESFSKHFGSYEELLEEECIKNYAQYEEYWHDMFPDELEWYQLDAVEDKNSGYRAVYLQHEHVLEQEGDTRKSAYTHDISEFLEWLIESVRNCIAALETGTYNETVENTLPARHRTGTILRKHLWEAFPQGREQYFENLTQEEADEFVACAVADKALLKAKLPSVTANDFFSYCAIGYAANQYDGTDKTPRDQYFKHADGRDEGLGEIDPDSSEAFSAWYHDRTRSGGHPWEVCRGGNSTHVDLHVVYSGDGYYLHVAGSSTWRSVEAIKFFLALHRAGLPVVIHQAEMLKSRLLGEEKIGIVPQGVFPCYCQSRFPGEEVEAFINLQRDDVEKLLPHCVWQPLTKTELY